VSKRLIANEIVNDILKYLKKKEEFPDYRAEVEEGIKEDLIDIVIYRLEKEE